MIWFIVGYMWLFLHRPFEVWPILGTIRLERVYMVITLVAWMTMGEKKITENKVNFAIALFIFAMVLSTLMSSYLDILTDQTLQNWLKYIVLYALLMTCVKTEKDLKIIITGFLICFALYMLHSYREFLCGRGQSRMGIWRMIGIDSTMDDPNTYGASIVLVMPMLLPAWTLVKEKWHYLALVAYALLSIRCVQLTGSRASFMGIGLALFAAAVLSKHRMKVIPAMAVLFVIIWVSLPASLQDRYMTVIDPSRGPENAQASVQGRWDGFHEGWEHWRNSPIWGTGPGTHRFESSNGLQAHNVYGQIPGEIGSVGIAAFLLLLSCYALNHYGISSHYKFLKEHGREQDGLYCYRVSYAVLFGVGMLLFFGIAGHNGYRYTWIWYAAFQATAMAVIHNKVLALRSYIAQQHLR